MSGGPALRMTMDHLIVAAWLAWMALWVIWSRHTKRILRHESRMSRALHLGPLVLAGLLLVDAHDQPALLTASLLPPSIWMGWSGLALTLAGLGFAIWARVIIAGNWSGTVTLKQDHELVQTGPYALVRHPIYTGLILALAGTALASNAPRGWLAMVIVTASFVRKLRTEEAFMRAAFGAAYDDYAGKVPALLPKLR